MYSLFQSLSVFSSQSLICSGEHTNGEVDGQGSYSNRQSQSEITAIDSVSPNSYQLFFLLLRLPSRRERQLSVTLVSRQFKGIAPRTQH